MAMELTQYTCFFSFLSYIDNGIATIQNFVTPPWKWAKTIVAMVQSNLLFSFFPLWSHYSLSSLLFFFTYSATPLPNFASLLIQLKIFEQYMYHINSYLTNIQPKYSVFLFILHKNGFYSLKLQQIMEVSSFYHNHLQFIK